MFFQVFYPVFYYSFSKFIIINLIIYADLTDINYIALADQDDIWKEDKLEKAIQKLEQGFDGYSSNVEAFWENGRKKTIIKNQFQRKFDHFHFHAHRVYL